MECRLSSQTDPISNCNEKDCLLCSNKLAWVQFFSKLSTYFETSDNCVASQFLGVAHLEVDYFVKKLYRDLVKVEEKGLKHKNRDK